MLKNLFIISCLVFTTLLSGVGNAEHSGLTIEGAPAITCDHMGTYTKATKQNGTSTWSHPIANVARATSAGVVDGLGWASININGSVNGRSGGSTLSYRIGTWGIDSGFRWAWESNNHTSERKVVTSYITGPTSTAEGTYNWDATGYVEGTPYYYSNGWQAGTKSKISGSATGDWKVVYKKVCSSCGEYVSDFTTHQVSCGSCRETYYTCSPSDTAKHSLQVCTDCVHGNNPGGVYPKCSGPHVCPGNVSNNDDVGDSGSSGDDDDDDDDDDDESSSGSSSRGSTNTPYRRGTPGYGQTFQERVNRDRICRRCGTTFNRRNNGTCYSRSGKTYRYHWGIDD